MADPTDFASNLAIAQQGATDVATNSLNAQRYQANQFELEQAQNAQKTAQAFSADLQQAGGDPAALQQLALKYPAQAKQIGEALGIQNEQHAMQVNQAVGDLALANSIGTDQAMAGALSKHRELISTLNSTPQELFQMWKQNPQQFASVISAAGMSTVPFQKQKELEAQNYRTDATLRGQNLQFDTAAANRQVQREGQQIQREGQQITRETNEVTREKTRQDMAAKRAEQGQAAQASIDAFNQQRDTLDRNFASVVNAVGTPKEDGTIDTSSDQYKEFQQGFGLAGWAQKNFPGTAAANTWGRIKGMQADARQMGIQGLKGLGSASDADAAAAQNAFLAIDDKTDAATAKQATEKYISVLNKYRKNLNSPEKLRQVDKAKQTVWATNRNIDPRAVSAYFEQIKKQDPEVVDRYWRDTFGIEPPAPEDFN